MESGQLLLTICIPTYNRASKLDYSLSRFEKELASVDASLLVFFISDNCSPDNTKEVVDNYIEKGLPIIYSRNEENIGPDNNFLKCFYAAKSKYLWLLGDDDYLLDGRLKTIIDILRNNEIGCLNLANNYGTVGVHKLCDNQKFLTKIGHWVTFMSGNIIRTDIIKQTIVDDELRNSNLLQVPFFVDAILSMPNNILIKDKIFEKDNNDNNSGYNFFVVFIEHYLDIFKGYRKNNKISRYTYWSIKRKLMWNFIIPIIAKFYIQKRYPHLGKEGALTILLKNYGMEPYFYLYFLKIPYVLFKDKQSR